MASLDDILTTQKNGVVAINNLAGYLKQISIDLTALADGAAFPSANSSTILASTTSLVYAGSGKIFSISIPVHSGAGQVYIYDSATTGGISASNCIFASEASTSSAFTPYQDIRLPFTYGLVVKTDAGMNACIGYSPNP